VRRDGLAVGRQVLDCKGDRLVRVRKRFLRGLALTVTAGQSWNYGDVPAVGVGLQNDAVL